MVFAPPWMKTMTGSGVLPVFAGASTLSVRQSSLLGWYFPGASNSPFLCWTEASPNLVASRSPVHGVTG